MCICVKRGYQAPSRAASSSSTICARSRDNIVRSVT